MKAYYLLVRKDDNKVMDYLDKSTNPNVKDWAAISGVEIIEKTFSENSSNDPDINFAKPELMAVCKNDYYSPPNRGCYLSLEWTGNVIENGNIKQIIANNSNYAVLNIKKFENITNSPKISDSDNESYYVCICSGNAVPDKGIVSLVNGKGHITFTPDSTNIGLLTVKLLDKNGLKHHGPAMLSIIQSST